MTIGVTVEDAVVEAEERRRGVELELEDTNEFDNDGVDVAGVAEAFVEVADSGVVEIGEVLEADSDVDVADGATTGVDEAVGVLDEEDCIKSVCVEEDVVLEVEFCAVEEGVTPEDVEVVASDETVDVAVEDESVVWADEKCTNEKPSMVNSTSPPAIPIRNELCFMSLIISLLVSDFY